MVKYIMKKEICGTFNAKCGTQDLMEVFGTFPRKAEQVVTLMHTHTLTCIYSITIVYKIIRLAEKCSQNPKASLLMVQSVPVTQNVQFY
jgi:hypothetical protein